MPDLWSLRLPYWLWRVIRVRTWHNLLSTDPPWWGKWDQREPGTAWSHSVTDPENPGVLTSPLYSTWAAFNPGHKLGEVSYGLIQILCYILPEALGTNTSSRVRDPSPNQNPTTYEQESPDGVSLLNLSSLSYCGNSIW